jgi:hypothetical protein
MGHRLLIRRPRAIVTAGNLTSGSRNFAESLPIKLGRHMDHNTLLPSSLTAADLQKVVPATALTWPWATSETVW